MWPVVTQESLQRNRTVTVPCSAFVQWENSPPSWEQLQGQRVCGYCHRANLKTQPRKGTQKLSLTALEEPCIALGQSTGYCSFVPLSQEGFLTPRLWSPVLGSETSRLIFPSLSLLEYFLPSPPFWSLGHIMLCAQFVLVSTWLLSPTRLQTAWRARWQWLAWSKDGTVISTRNW